jgi:hypothetical protein
VTTNINVSRSFNQLGLKCIYKEIKDIKDINMQNASSILKGFIQNAIKQTILIRELIIEYDPADKKNDYIWTIYNNYKST